MGVELLDDGVGVGVGVGLGEGDPELEDEGADPAEELDGAGVPAPAEPGGAEPEGAEPEGAELVTDGVPHGDEACALAFGADPELEPDEPLPLLEAPLGTFHVHPFTSRQRLFEERELHETG